jgi:hypothetical protein
MADTVTTTVASDTGIRYDAVFTNISDGTGETNVVKIRLSDLRFIGTDEPPSAMDVEYIEATVNGFDSVSLAWDRAPAPKVFAVLPGGNSTTLKFKRYLPDPDRHQQGSTGDILLTTNGTETAQDSYVIRFRGRLRK